jgi:formylglycine-generating enzyme required for sulfatase activity
VSLRAGERRAEAVRLEPRLGDVVVAVRPPDAELLVDGEPRGRADQTLRLLAVPHEIEIRRVGYVGVKRTVTPTPGFPQAIRLSLESAEEAKRRSQPERLRSPAGHELRLVRGLQIRMGAPRREPGRRANEPQRDVVLERPFYVALAEVSNAQYRRFDPKHSSGRVAEQSLDMDEHPVVRLTWQQAAAYCNWLSASEGLAPVYTPQGERLRAVSPIGAGYRLPTEAEWEAVARYADGGEPLRYPWGRALPVPPGFGNYADASAAGLIAQLLPGYDDGFRATAPVASFAPNGLGFYHLGDNVAEWTHDLYTIVPSAEGQTVKDPTGPAEGEYHVIRGASWMHAGATELRLSFRDYGKEVRPDLGFRIARYAE